MLDAPTKLKIKNLIDQTLIPNLEKHLQKQNLLVNTQNNQQSTETEDQQNNTNTVIPIETTTKVKDAVHCNGIISNYQTKIILDTGSVGSVISKTFLEMIQRPI